LARFTVLNASLAADVGQWSEVWADSPEREVFAHPAYVELEAGRLQGSGMCAVLRLEGVTAMYPFIVRDLSREAYFPAEESAAYDITSPYGYSGPTVWGHTPGNDQMASEFWRCFDAWAGAQRIVAEFIRFPLFPEACLAYPGDKWVVAQHVVRSLQISDEQLWREVEHKVRKNVNRARRDGVTIVIDPDGRDLESFLDIYDHTMERRGASQAYRYRRDFFECLGREIPTGLCYFHAVVAGRIVSTELVLVSTSSVYSFLGGTLTEYFDHRPNELLKFEIIHWARDHGKSRFVLGGGYRPADGIYRYKLALSPRGAIDYIQGGRIFNKALYETLIERRKRIAPEGNDGPPRFFPAYRA
jgi:CelD/BcsL family acetyltransferase involved in cellulose biosynthesis